MDHKVFISEDDEYLFGQGTHYEIYKKLGSHCATENGKKGEGGKEIVKSVRRVKGEKKVKKCNSY